MGNTMKPLVNYRKEVCLPALAAFLIFGGSAPVALAQQNQGSGQELGVFQVRPNFYMIVGAGSNIAVQFGQDGVVVVDPGLADMSDKVLAAIKRLTDEPIRYIIDTSAEADHVGANEKVAAAGENLTSDQGENQSGRKGGPATIIATENVLDRMSAPTGKKAAFPQAAWPTQTFFQKQMAMYLNQDAIVITSEPAAHSDGDAIVFFRRSDVIVAGEILDTRRFPVIDIDKGGSIQGEVDALNHIVELAVPSIPLIWEAGGTYVIPAHGFICDQADVVEYRDMITVIRDIVQSLIKKGMTLEQIKAADPTRGYRSQYGSDSGPWTTDMFVEAVYKSLIAKK
jgi:glyoxylase-like metal-dependent hydrolase (beta-lactamase superfamily II)